MNGEATMKHCCYVSFLLITFHLSRYAHSKKQPIITNTPRKCVNITCQSSGASLLNDTTNIALCCKDEMAEKLFNASTQSEFKKKIFTKNVIRSSARKKRKKRYQFGHRLNHYFSRIVALYLVLIIVVALVCNIILIISIIRIRSLHSFMHFLLVNMAIGDIITAIGTIPFDVEFLLYGHFSRNLIVCGITQTTFFISLPSSVLCLTLITAERFITIVFSFQEIITKRRVVTAVVVMWIYTVITGCFPLLYQRNAVRVAHGYCWLKFPIGYQIYQVTVNFLIPIIFIIAVYVKLFVISCAHANKTAKTINTIGTMLLDPVDKGDANQNSQRCQHPRMTCCAMFYRNIKASKRIALLVGVFLLCWLPFIVLAAVNYVCRCIPREVTWLANAVNYSSVAINPLLYGLLNKQIRKEVMRKLKMFRQNIPAEHSFIRTGSLSFSLSRQGSRNRAIKVAQQTDTDVHESRGERATQQRGL